MVDVDDTDAKVCPIVEVAKKDYSIKGKRIYLVQWYTENFGKSRYFASKEAAENFCDMIAEARAIVDDPRSRPIPQEIEVHGE